MITEQLWMFPEPPTSIATGPVVSQLPRRELELSFGLLDPEDNLRAFRIRFADVKTYRVTYLHALGVLDLGVSSEAYGALVRAYDDPWFAGVVSSCARYASHPLEPKGELQHLIVKFDDGPCFEFICRGYRVEEDRGSAISR